MRRRRARILFWSVTLASGLLSLRGPSLGEVQASAAMLFAPVSRPAYTASLWASRVLQGEKPLDAASPRRPRSSDAVFKQNAQLRTQVLYLQGELLKLQEIHKDRSKLGQPLLAKCAAVAVVGSDGPVLNVVNNNFARLQRGMAVLQYGQTTVGIAGVVSAVGVASGQVRLVTDPQLRIEGEFVDFPANSAVPTPRKGPRPLVEGTGDGRCQVARFAQADLTEYGVKVGDWVTLQDEGWPAELTGLRIGRVTKFEPLAAEPGFTRVVVEPDVDFASLREVMVLVR